MFYDSVLAEGGSLFMGGQKKFLLTQLISNLGEDKEGEISIYRYLTCNSYLEGRDQNDGDENIEMLRNDHLVVSLDNKIKYQDFVNLEVFGDEEMLRSKSLTDEDWFQELINTSKK